MLTTKNLLVMLATVLWTSTSLHSHAQDTKKPVRIPVAIYEMRSSVSEVQARAATDMFTTALVKTRKFRVMERQRIGDGVAKERDLNAQGITTGDAATKKVKGAGVIFEATISEVSVGKSTSDSGFAIGGLQIGGGKAEDGMGIDVRVLDAATGEVLDAINVRRAIKSSASSVSGVGSLLDNVLAAKGKSTGGFTPDLSNKSTARDSMDETLRLLIEEAVNQLASRSGDWELE